MLQIDRQFHGRSRMPLAEPGGDVLSGPLTLVVRDAKGFEDFLSTIPKKRVQKRQPAPPSTDPLLKDPQIDFKTHCLVVVKRGSMYVHPEIERVEAQGQGARVLYRMPPLGDTIHGAAIMDMGTYCAALVPRFEGEASFERLPNPAEGEQRQQAR